MNNIKLTIGTTNTIEKGKRYEAIVTGEDDLNIFIHHSMKSKAEEIGQQIAAIPELLQIVYDLKECIKRLSQDGLTQFDRDTEAQHEGEAHELLVRIKPDYYKNANEQ